MTKSDVPVTGPFVLVDDPDGYPENHAWVEVTRDTGSPEQAAAYLDQIFPMEDRPEEEHFTCDGEQVWLERVVEAEDAETGEGENWRAVDPTREKPVDGARLFWVIGMACHA
jgi:hypothetical protein